MTLARHYSLGFNPSIIRIDLSCLSNCWRWCDSSKIFFQNLPISLTKLECHLLQTDYGSIDGKAFQQIWPEVAKCEQLKEFRLTIVLEGFGKCGFRGLPTTNILIKGDEGVKLPSIKYFHITSVSNPVDHNSILSMLDKGKLRGFQIFSNEYCKHTDAKWFFAKLQNFTNLRYLYMHRIAIGEIVQSVYEDIRNCVLKLRDLKYLRLIFGVSKGIDPIISTQLKEILRSKRKLKLATIKAETTKRIARKLFNSLNKCTKIRSALDFRMTYKLLTKYWDSPFQIGVL